MLGRIGLGLAGHAVESLEQHLAQRPAGAVAGEHVEVVDVDVGVAMRLADLRRIDVRQPIVGDYLARHVEDQSAQRIPLVGVGPYPPVGAIHVLVDGGRHVHQRATVLAQSVVLVAIGNVSAECPQVVGVDQGLFDHILHLLDGGRRIGIAVANHLEHASCQQLRLIHIEFTAGGTGASQCRSDALDLERYIGTVTTQDATRQRRGNQGYRFRDGRLQCVGTHWQASHSGLSIEQNFGSSCATASSRPPAFSAWLAPSVRR